MHQSCNILNWQSEFVEPMNYFQKLIRPFFLSSLFFFYKQHANFPQFLEEEEDSPVAILFNPKHELTYSVNNQKVLSHNYNINHEMELMDEDEDEPSASLMEVENKTECNEHHCMLPQVPQKRSAYLWSGII